MKANIIDDLKLELIEDDGSKHIISKLCRSVSFILSDITINSHYFVSRPNISMIDRIKPETELQSEENAKWNCLLELKAKGTIKIITSEYEIQYVQLFTKESINIIKSYDFNLFAYSYTSENSCIGLLASNYDDKSDSEVTITITIPFKVLDDAIDKIYKYKIKQLDLIAEMHAYYDNISLYINKENIEKLQINSVSFII